MPATGVSRVFGRRLGAAVKEAGASRRGPWGAWFTPHSAAAARAILERVPTVDLLVEVRDARIPLSSAFQPVPLGSCSHKRVILLNKVDLADRSQTENWIKHFKELNYICYGVNSHNKENIKELLSILRARIRDIKVEESNYTATLMLVGIPNVGKSAIANSMHQIGRISAAEKGKLKHAIVSSMPGETKDISSYKIASHPNIYVLDTPGILLRELSDAETASKIALTGAIKDSLVGVCALAQYFLSILNSNDEYKRWESFSSKVNDDGSSSHNKEKILNCDFEQKKKQWPSDHTQDFIVRDVRQTLFKTISSFEGYLENEVEMSRLIEHQFAALREAFRVPFEATEDGYSAVAIKLLNLYRTGRLGRYTLDPVPKY
uniref:Mitochondrial GTPase 1 n=1 Tax=Anthurium amnicola TaxID=1678845 RepID=A0A1D1XTV6_9ARAE